MERNVILTGDCREVMAGFEPESIDAIVTDPPYNLTQIGRTLQVAANLTRKDRGPNQRRMSGGFMGKSWDGDGIAFRPEMWAAAYRVAKPGAYLLAFGGTRTVHRMTCAIEDAGWIIRDMLVWGYASGFPKSKACLKPAWEPIVMARKPGPLRMLAIDECRMPAPDADPEAMQRQLDPSTFQGKGGNVQPTYSPLGRWPANVILSDEIFEPGVPGVVMAGSLSGTMTAWSQSPDSEPSPTSSPVASAERRSSRGVPGVSFRSSATEPAATHPGVWDELSATPKPDIGCSDGTTEADPATSGSTAESGRTPTGRSPLDASSIIETATASTTTSATSNSSPEPSTTGTTRLNRPESSGIVATARPGTSEPLSDDSVNWRRNSATAESRAGEASADRRYPGAFAALPGERRDGDSGTYSRFFLIPKAARSDREPVLGGLPMGRGGSMEGGVDTRTGLPVQGPSRANVHPTVKPTELMRHLVRLVTPPGGVCLDPFAGSGTTGLACQMEGFDWIMIEKEAEYVAIAEARLNGAPRGMGL